MRKHFPSTGRGARAARAQFPQTKPRAPLGGAREKLAHLRKLPSPARLNGDFTRFAVSKIEMKSPRATAVAERQRSRSEADTGRRTGLCFGPCCSSGSKTATGFRTAPGRAVGRVFAVRRTAGPARWAFGPPPERAARTQQNGASFELRIVLNLWVDLLAELLRLAEPRSSPPPHAAGCNSTELVAFTAGGKLL